MKKLILAVLLLLIPSLTFAGSQQIRTVVGMCKETSSFSCSSTPFQSQTSYSAAHHLGSTDSFYYVGFANDGSSDLTFCAIDLYVQEFGSLSGKTVYIEKWSVNSSNNDLTSKVEDVGSFDPTAAGSSIAIMNIPLGKSVTLSQHQALVFTMREVTGASNYFRIAYQGSNVVADQHVDNWTSGLLNSTIAYDLASKLYAEE